MRFSRSEPGFIVSLIAHAGLFLAAVVLFGSAEKFDDAPEMIPIDVVSDSELNSVTKGEKTAKEVRPAQRVDRVADKTDLPPEPPLNAANKDVPAPPPQAPRRPEPGREISAEPPSPPKRVAATPPAKEPPPVDKKIAKPPEDKATPPAREKSAKADDKPEPDEAEVVKPKPPARPKLDKAEEKPSETPPKPPKPRLRADDVAKLLEKRKEMEKDKPDTEAVDKPVSDAKPKSGDETAPKSRFDLASIANLLSREAPQRRAATGQQASSASLGAPEGAAQKLSASMESRIAAYIHDHYHPCWVSALSLGGATYAPVVEFHLSREGELEGRPKLVNGSSNAVERARGEQALQAVRRCSPMKIPAEFMPYYEEVLRDVTIRFRDEH